MKDMIKRIREEREGFTLAELLIVVAIIAVLVAIAIPVFNSQLEKSREATDMANIRAAYAEVVAAALTDDQHDQTATVTLVQKDMAKWENTSGDIAGVKLSELTPAATIDVKYTASTGKVTIGGKEAKSNAGVTVGSGTAGSGE